MTGTRQFHVVIGGEASRTRKIKNGVPHGSVIAPCLFNVYISDMPDTESLKLGYADDWVLAHQSKSWNEIERVLSRDTTVLKSYFDQWYLKMNTTKTESSVFNLDNHQANKSLNITVEGAILPFDRNPKYLGVTLDRQLTYKKHIEGCANKIAKRNCILRKLCGTSWGASQTVLRTSSLALCYSVAEYCAPVWTRSSHTNRIDVQLRESMRTISGCLKSTPIQWLPTMCAIAPPHIRREEASQRTMQRIKTMPDNIPLRQVTNNAPATTRLKSRKPFYNSGHEDFNPVEAWNKEWTEKTPTGGAIIENAAQSLPGLRNYTWKYWVASNRLLTRHGRTASNMHKWHLKDSPTCPHCETTPQTTDHLVLHCPVTRLEGGYETILSDENTFTTWIDTFKLEV